MRASLRFALRGCGCPLDRAADAWVAAAAAQVANAVDVGVGWFRFARQQVDGRHDLAGLAVAAQDGVFVDPGLLHRVQRAVRFRQALDRGDVLVREVGHRQRAGALELAAHQHAACAAALVVAAVLATGQPQHVAQVPQQGQGGIAGVAKLLAVDGNVDALADGLGDDPGGRGLWGLWHRLIVCVVPEWLTPDRRRVMAVFIGHAAACRYGSGLNTVRVERLVSDANGVETPAALRLRPRGPMLRANGSKPDHARMARAIAFCRAARNTWRPCPRGRAPFAIHPPMTASAAAPLASDAPWVVLKFGGTSVATADRWRTIQQLAAARRAEGARVVIVVSALAGVTDALKALCACTPSEREMAVAKLVERH